MKIYKFRQLTDERDCCRLMNILETGHFWCSNFWELNDPMEGVFSFYGENEEIIKNGIRSVFDEKNKYKICSFSSEKGFENPIMWGYYAAGFKGVAVELEVKESEVVEVKYKEKIIDIFSNDDYDFFEIAKKILARKLEAWTHESEYRFFKKEELENSNYYKIGKITAVYFGNPYGNIENKNQVREKSKDFAQYERFKEKIIKIVKEKNIEYSDVKIEKDVVKKIDKNL